MDRWIECLDLVERANTLAENSGDEVATLKTACLTALCASVKGIHGISGLRETVDQFLLLLRKSRYRVDVACLILALHPVLIESAPLKTVDELYRGALCTLRDGNIKSIKHPLLNGSPPTCVDDKCSWLNDSEIDADYQRLLSRQIPFV